LRNNNLEEYKVIIAQKLKEQEEKKQEEPVIKIIEEVKNYKGQPTQVAGPAFLRPAKR